jgi:hypothetical protein
MGYEYRKKGLRITRVKRVFGIKVCIGDTMGVNEPGGGGKMGVAGD